MTKSVDSLRSQRWFAPDNMRAFAHRQRTQQTGRKREDFEGRPVIAIINTWSDISTCHVHLRERANFVKEGIIRAGGYPLEMPAMSLGEVMVKPTAMLYRNFLAMETEELLRSHPVDAAPCMDVGNVEPARRFPARVLLAGRVEARPTESAQHMGST